MARGGGSGGAGRRKTDLLLWLYDGRCFWCSGTISRNVDANDHYSPTLDEMKPRYRGGFRTLDNQVIAHRICNMRRGDQIAPQSAFERHWAMLREHGLFCDSPER